MAPFFRSVRWFLRRVTRAGSRPPPAPAVAPRRDRAHGRRSGAIFETTAHHRMPSSVASSRTKPGGRRALRGVARRATAAPSRSGHRRARPGASLRNRGRRREGWCRHDRRAAVRRPAAFGAGDAGRRHRETKRKRKKHSVDMRRYRAMPSCFGVVESGAPDDLPLRPGPRAAFVAPSPRRTDRCPNRRRATNAGRRAPSPGRQFGSSRPRRAAQPLRVSAHSRATPSRTAASASRARRLRSAVAAMSRGSWKTTRTSAPAAASARQRCGNMSSAPIQA